MDPSAEIAVSSLDLVEPYAEIRRVAALSL